MLKHLPPAAKITAIENLYKAKWWTCERMREYFHFVKDDSSRVQVHHT